ncbi:MAG: aminodeoxychorismate lyase [Psychromonas sp.]
MLINGIETTKIAATDRGLAYGDGLFSTVKIESGVVQLWDYHLKRMQLGAQKLFFPAIDWLLLTNEVENLATTLLQHSHAIIKVILTRGSGGRGYSITGCDSPQRILSVHAFPQHYQQWQEQGIKVVQCTQTLSLNRQLAGLKTLNRLEQVLIKHELESINALEGIVCDNNGDVIEACSANVFIYVDKQWLTPKLDHAGVAGVKRQQLLDLAKNAGISIIEKTIKPEHFFTAQAACLTNALMGIVPITQYQSYCYPADSFTYINKLKSLLLQGDVLDVD